MKKIMLDSKKCKATVDDVRCYGTGSFEFATCNKESECVLISCGVHGLYDLPKIRENKKKVRK